MSFEENTEVKTTTHYWGYRELSTDELLMVGGGDIGDYGGGGDRGYGDGANYSGDSSTYAGVSISGKEYALSNGSFFCSAVGSIATTGLIQLGFGPSAYSIGQTVRNNCNDTH